MANLTETRRDDGADVNSHGLVSVCPVPFPDRRLINPETDMTVSGLPTTQ